MVTVGGMKELQDAALPTPPSIPQVRTPWAPPKHRASSPTTREDYINSGKGSVEVILEGPGLRWSAVSSRVGRF